MTIVAKNLTCFRGHRCILQDVSFTLEASDCLILRGPNGIGKSTLLRVLAGLNSPSSGALSYNNDNIVYAGHLDAVKLQLTVLENLSFWAGIYDVADTNAVLKQFGLTEFANRPAATLSAGQKRRLGLARLSLSNRLIWLMDEPTTSLDAEHTKLIADCINAHCASGGIAIISTHLDLDINGAKTLDLSNFAPDQAQYSSPFLEGEF